MTDFNTVIRNVLGSHGKAGSLCSFDINSQFSSGEGIQKTNAAFLIALAGPAHALHAEACTHLDNEYDDYAGFLKNALARLEKEIRNRLAGDEEFADHLKQAAEQTSGASPAWNEDTRERLWRVFFPEGVACASDRDAAVADLRKKRTVRVTQLNGSPLSDPAKELLFTSNILLTIPSSEDKLQQAGLSQDLTNRIREVSSEPQLFYFDHPVQIGVETDKNEIIYGLRGLNEALAFEKKRGNMAPNDTATCVLSVSVTHEGLHHVTKDYLDAEFGKIAALAHLNIHVFTEAHTRALIDEVLTPIAKQLLPGADPSILYRVFGVDGEYGRHYSFLKAIAALWQVLIDPATRATFKIDLDQVFPQKVLSETTGHSAFEHYMSPLWGAEGLDADGNRVELGMIAGALVNENDIDKGLFTPDVPFPETIPNNENVFFMSKLPMAASTAAEMETRYGTDGIDGESTCIHRIHVTGGTNGILMESLRKYRPFTPTFIGRAEDQAYLMSVLFSEHGPSLRYVHRDGLVMRHDKYAFAGEAIQAAAVGRQTGDLVRLLYFSGYARGLPWPVERIKDVMDPFTGCFISRMPVTITMLRLGITLAEMYEKGDPLAEQLAAVAVQRLGDALENMDVAEDYTAEREAWDLYYDILDAAEKAGPAVDDIRNKAIDIIDGCRIAAGS